MSERDHEYARVMNELDELRRRPSQHGAAWIRRVAEDASELLRSVVTDLRGWEAEATKAYSTVRAQAISVEPVIGNPQDRGDK